MISKVDATEYPLGQTISINGKVFQSSKAKHKKIVIKELDNSKRSTKEIINEGEGYKLKMEGEFGTAFPQHYFEDKGKLYVVYEKFQQSMEDVIQNQKKKGQYIPMSIMKDYVSNYVDILARVHNKVSHCRLKPSNLMTDLGQDGSLEYIITDFLPFSNDNNEEYYSPEMMVAVNKNQSQKFLSNKSIFELAGGEPWKLDVWQLGICFLQMATLKPQQELLAFRDQNASNQVKVIEIKEFCQKLYGDIFKKILDEMLQRNNAQRPKLSNLLNLTAQFLEAQDIDHSSMKFKPDVDVIMKQIMQKITERKKTLQEYLHEYEFIETTCKIKPLKFYDATDDLGIHLDNDQKAAIEQQYDKERTGELDFSPFLVKKDKVKMGILKMEEEQELQQYMRDLFNYMESNKLKLYDNFKNKDAENTGHIPLQVFFDMLKQIKAEPPNPNVIIKKFDPQKQQVIYYQYFYDELQALNSSQQGIAQVKKDLYKKIRDKYVTFIQFFRFYDSKQQGFLSYDDINKCLNDFKVFMVAKVNKALLEGLDPYNNRKVQFSNFRDFFQPLVEEEIKGILTQIAYELNNIQMTLGQLIRQNTKSATTITSQALFNCLRQLNNQFLQNDFNFLMSYFLAEKKDEIYYPEFLQAVFENAKKFDVKYFVQFSEKMMQEKKEDFDESIDQTSTMKKSININIQNFMQSKPLIDMINSQLDMRDLVPQKYFKAINSQMSKVDFKKKVKDLDIDLNTYDNEYDDLVFNILVPNDRLSVDIDIFVEVLNLLKDAPKSAKAKKLPMNLIYQYFGQLNDAMKKNDFSFADFEALDNLQDGTLRRKIFEATLLKQLNLQVQEESYKAFIQYIQKSESFIELQKLRVGLQLDQKATRLLTELNQELTQNKSKPDQVFRKYDANKNTKLELREFVELIKQIVEVADQKVIEVLFYKLDVNGDLTLSLNEFRAKVTGQQEKLSLQTGKYKYKDMPQQKKLNAQIMKSVLQLKEAMMENGVGLEQFDKKQRGVFLIAAFKDVIENQLSLNFVEFKGLAQYLTTNDNSYLSTDKFQSLFDSCRDAQLLLEEINKMINTEQVQVVKLFNKYDENDNSELDFSEFQELIKEIDPTASKVATEALFYLLDSNQDAAISIQEFKSKIMQKERPKLVQKEQSRVSAQEDLIKYLKQSSFAREAFENADSQGLRRLSYTQIYDEIKNDFKLKLSPQDIKQLAQQFLILNGDFVDYYKLIKKCEEYQFAKPLSKVDSMLKTLKETLEYKQSSIVEIGQRNELTEQGKCKLSLLKQEFVEKNIKLSETDWDIILSIVEPDQKGQVDYVVLNQLVSEGFEAFKNRKKDVIIDANKEIDKIVNLIEQRLEERQCTLFYFFKQTDRNEDKCLQHDEFKNMLEINFNYKTNEKLQFELFQIFDMDRDGKINYTEFEYQVYKRQEVNYSQIEEFKRLILRGRNPSLDDHIFELFNSISQNEQFFNFKQFIKYARQIKQYKILELDQLFRFFDPTYLEQVNAVMFSQTFRGQNHVQVQWQSSLPVQGAQFQNPGTYQPDGSPFSGLGGQQYPQQQFQQYPTATSPGYQQPINQQQAQFQQFPNQQFQQQNQQQFPNQQMEIKGQPQFLAKYQEPMDELPPPMYTKGQPSFGQQSNLNNQQQYQQYPNQQQQYPNQQQQYPNQQQQYPNKQQPNQNQQYLNQQQQQQFPSFRPNTQNQPAHHPLQQPDDYDQQLSIQQKQFNKNPRQSDQFFPNTQQLDQNLQQVGFQGFQGFQQPPQAQNMPPQPPQEYDRIYYEQQLKLKCIEFQVDLFDIMCQYDKTVTPEFKIPNIPDLQKVFDFLEIQIPQKHISRFFADYCYPQQQQMTFTHLYLLAAHPGLLIAKALNFTILKHQDYTVKILYDRISGNQQYWTINHLALINQNLNLQMTQAEIQEALKYWDKGTGKVLYKQYEDIMSKTQIQVPKKQKSSQNKVISQFDEFMKQLEVVVQQRNCFNLFEKCDKQQYNEISINDFEKVVKQLMSVSQDDIQSVKINLSKDGYVNLSDLAKALKVDRQKAQKSTYNVEDEKKQFGIGKKGPKQQVVNVNLQEKFKQIVPIISDFLKKKQRTNEDLAFMFFPANSASTINKIEFTKVCFDKTIGISQQQAEDLFDYLDVNQSGSISINELRLVFPFQQKQQVKKNAEAVVMGKEIEDEIKELFDLIDENKNQSLDQRELHKALCSVGLNPSTEELLQYFQQFDRDGSGTISYQEFSIIVKDILKKEMLSADDLLEELRKEFRQVCNPATRMLSKEQVAQVFLNLGVQVKGDELDDLFHEIDEDQSGSVDIDEFIYFIQKNQSGMSAKASVAVMNIKGARRMSLHDLKQIFQQLPNNFIISFIRNQNKKLLNLPSSVLKPQLDPCGLFYQGIQYKDTQQLDIKQSVLEKQNVKNQLLYEIHILEATGVPIPQEKQFLGNREVGIIMMDKMRNKFENNSVYIPASWKAEYEDRWLFEMPVSDQSFIIRHANFDPKLDNMQELIFELIIYSNQKNKLMQISCAYGSIPLNQLKPGKFYIDLKGGAPLKDIAIDQKDIRTERTGWRSLVKTLSSSIKSQILIEVTEKFTPQVKQKLNVIPQKCLLNRWALNMWAGYREYFAYRTIMKGDIELNLACDIRIKSWLNIVDCPNCHKQVATFWNDSIENTNPNHQRLIEIVQTIADCFYLMFKNGDFKFNQGDPTARFYHDQAFNSKRDQLVQEAIQDAKISLKLVQNAQAKKSSTILNQEPLNIEEMLDLDNEADIAAMEKFFSKKRARLGIQSKNDQLQQK